MVKKKYRKCNNRHTQWIPFCKSYMLAVGIHSLAHELHDTSPHLHFLKGLITIHSLKPLQEKKKEKVTLGKRKMAEWDLGQRSSSRNEWTTVYCTEVYCSSVHWWKYVIWDATGDSCECWVLDLEVVRRQSFVLESDFLFLFSFGLLNHLNLYTFCCLIITQRDPFWKCSGMEY